MTTVTFHSEEDRIIGFDLLGHSGYADEGSDIVCAAVSSAANLANAVVNDVLGLCASVKSDPERAALSFRIPGGLSETDEATCQNLLTGMMVYLSELAGEYPEFLAVKADFPEEDEAEAEFLSSDD
ncbi:MAG: ribosomal-processing cysteine protease Prp [Clostridiales bacterium]|nr:ribosomal-processing cysteine protease Prp [Clostridiales bacterium]